MIVKAAIKAQEEIIGKPVSANSHKPASDSVSVHNLTELRRKLEEKMLITTYAQNRPVQSVQESWPSYHSTPCEDDEDGDFDDESRHRQSEESEVEVKAFGKGRFAAKETMIASELRNTETVDSDFMRTTNVFKTQRI